MLKVLLTLSSGIILSSTFAQHFTFSDTHPASNLDSLKQWLKVHPQPTEERLKNLIRAERTYFFLYPENMGDHLSEIKTLAARLHSPLGQTAHSYLEARAYIRDEKRPLAFEDLLKAYREFIDLKDTSGIIHASAGLVVVNYGIASDNVGDSLSAGTYLQIAESLLKKRPNVHDSFVVMAAHISHVRGFANPDFYALLKYAQTYLRLCESSPNYSYAWIVTMHGINVGYQYTNNYRISYQVCKKILSRLTPDQLFHRIRSLYNLGLACGTLNRRTEQLHLCEQALVLLQELKKKCPYPQMEFNLLHALQEVHVLQKNYKKAHFYTYELVAADRALRENQQIAALVNLTKKYELSEKQKQIVELTLQQTQSENRTRFIVTLLGIAFVVILSLGFLGWRLRQANARLLHLTQVREQLFGMVAHDLRRPMFAFQNIKALVGFHLRKQNYAAIEKLSIALDESGLRLQKMLDNLVAWAMSQQETLPYQPQNLRLYERVQTIVDLYSGVNLLKNVRFEVDIPESLTAYADNGFDLVVRNLIDNSFKALSTKGYLRISARLSENQELLLKLEDNAGGMTAEVLDIVQSVFDAPERAQIGEKNMGMGLIMVGRFVKRNQGRIQVHSISGQGTMFRLWLPLQ